MKIAVKGFDGPLAKAVGAELTKRGHVLSNDADCLIYIPGDAFELARLIDSAINRKVVLRSSAFAYGADPKNPGDLTEERGPILHRDAPEQRWLGLEELVLARGGACLRMATILAPEEGDLIARKLAKHWTTSPFGRDPQVQFLSLQDAARALVRAAETDASGIFNIAGKGSIPLKRAYRAAGVKRIPTLPPPGQILGRRGVLSQLEFNTTVSGEKARQTLGFEPEASSVNALRAFVKSAKHREPVDLRDHYDDWGLDLEYIEAWTPWFQFLQKVYWRVEIEGEENIPATGRGVFVSNHRGFMPLDAVIHLAVVRRLRKRTIRFLIIPSLLRMPFLTEFLTKLGGVVASQENAAKLFAEDNLVGILPEGIRGSFTPYSRAYKLRGFERSAFARIAVQHQAPILPAVVVGHAEIFPIIGRFDRSWVRSELGWPYFPIAPMFPLAPIPIPSKWHIRILPQIPLDGLGPRKRTTRPGCVS
ncbi:MAG: 1-acyl-sn-glycerol-3-phosphate acyltransferase [Bryobacterales bacterium]